MPRAFRLTENVRGEKSYAGYLEARAKDQNPQMKPALDRFRRFAKDPKPMTPDAPKNPGNLSISHLPPDPQTRVLARSEVARKTIKEYWAYVAEQDAKEARRTTPKDSAS